MQSQTSIFPRFTAFLYVPNYLICDIIWNFAAVFTHKGFKIVDRITRHFLSLFFTEERVKHNTHAWIKGDYSLSQCYFYQTRKRVKKCTFFLHLTINSFRVFSWNLFLCDRFFYPRTLIISLGGISVFWAPLKGYRISRIRISWETCCGRIN